MSERNLVATEGAPTTEMQEHLRKAMRDMSRRDSGRMDSLRAGVLSLVVAESYERAAEELRAYVAARTEFPNYQERSSRYVEHCCDLIQAVQTKRNFPGLASLSMSKQQELHEKVLEHFEELKQNLVHIEKVEREHKLEDVRSTVWVVYALTLVTFAILVAGFLADIRSGVLSSTVHEAYAIMDEFSDKVVAKMPWP